MKRIVDRIQYQSLPTKHGAATLIRPSDWEIHFLDGDNGINEFHFYTLNRSDLSYAICHILGLRVNSR